MTKMSRPERMWTLDRIRAELISLSGTATSAKADLRTILRIKAAADVYSAILKSYELELKYFRGAEKPCTLSDFIEADE